MLWLCDSCGFLPFDTPVSSHCGHHSVHKISSFAKRVEYTEALKTLMVVLREQ